MTSDVHTSRGDAVTDAHRERQSNISIYSEREGGRGERERDREICFPSKKIWWGLREQKKTQYFPRVVLHALLVLYCSADSTVQFSCP